MSQTSAKDNLERFLSSGIDLARVSLCAKSIRSRDLTVPAEAFVSNLTNVDRLVTVPYWVAAEGTRSVFFTIKYAETFKDQWEAVFKGSEPAHFSSKEERATAAWRTLHEFLGGEKGVGDTAELMMAILQAAVQKQQFQECCRVLNLSAVILLWSAVECLAKDAWVIALNVGDIKFAHRAITFMAEDDTNGISNKSINVGILAKYGFNIRGQLGSLLSTKFRFSDLVSVKKAYFAAFGEREFGTLFDASDIRELEEARHLIVHNAARIDKKFRDATGSVQEIGEELIVTADKVSQFAGAAANIGVPLLQKLDDWLAPTITH